MTICAWLFIALLAPLIVTAQNAAPSPSSFEKILEQASKSRRHYVETFKNLTAEETKLTEIFDEDGTVTSQRKVLSYLIVYQSERDNQYASEYRVTREVDGRLIHNSARRAEKLFNDLSRAKTTKEETERLREENMRHTLRYYRWNVTLHPAASLEEIAWPYYDYEITGREKPGEQETVILSYSRKSLTPAEARGLLRDFKNPQVGDRGRVWLDARTFQICRWENEHIARHFETGKILVIARDEVDYVKSEFGIMVPGRLITTFFDSLKWKKGHEPRALTGGRITYTYSPFKRFNVTSREEITPIKQL
jgi:hypothetical protein